MGNSSCCFVLPWYLLFAIDFHLVHLCRTHARTPCLPRVLPLRRTQACEEICRTYDWLEVVEHGLVASVLRLSCNNQDLSHQGLEGKYRHATQKLLAQLISSAVCGRPAPTPGDPFHCEPPPTGPSGWQRSGTGPLGVLRSGGMLIIGNLSFCPLPEVRLLLARSMNAMAKAKGASGTDGRAGGRLQPHHDQMVKDGLVEALLALQVR